MPDFVNRHKASKGNILLIAAAGVVTLASVVGLGVALVWMLLETIAPAGPAPVAHSFKPDAFNSALSNDAPHQPNAGPFFTKDRRIVPLGDYVQPYGGGRARPHD